MVNTTKITDIIKDALEKEHQHILCKFGQTTHVRLTIFHVGIRHECTEYSKIFAQIDFSTDVGKDGLSGFDILSCDTIEEGQQALKDFANAIRYPFSVQNEGNWYVSSKVVLP